MNQVNSYNRFNGFSAVQRNELCRRVEKLKPLKRLAELFDRCFAGLRPGVNET